MKVSDLIKYLDNLLENANDTSKDRKLRIKHWSEWGVSQRDTHSMGKALRQINNLISDELTKT